MMEIRRGGRVGGIAWGGDVSSSCPGVQLLSSFGGLPNGWSVDDKLFCDVVTTLAFTFMDKSQKMKE